ncbi:MAG: DUF3145 domain-containing protein [Angustibacter sp.]
MSLAPTRGVVFVHSAPAALCPHLEWAIGQVLDVPASLDWTPQPADPGHLRAELSWQAASGTGARLASALRGWQRLRFEVTEEPTSASDGSRWSHTPTLGMHHAIIGVHGDVLLAEERVRSALLDGAVDASQIAERMHQVLGTAWDAELEPFRYAGDGAPVRWLHRVG